MCCKKVPCNNECYNLIGTYPILVLGQEIWFSSPHRPFLTGLLVLWTPDYTQQHHLVSKTLPGGRGGLSLSIIISPINTTSATTRGLVAEHNVFFASSQHQCFWHKKEMFCVGKFWVCQTTTQGCMWASFYIIFLLRFLHEWANL